MDSFFPSNYNELHGLDLDFAQAEVTLAVGLHNAFVFEEEASLATEIFSDLTKLSVGEEAFAAVTAPEIALPLLIGAGAYALYEWLKPKQENPTGSIKPNPVYKPPVPILVGHPVQPVPQKQEAPGVAFNHSVPWQETVPTWALRSRRRRR